MALSVGGSAFDIGKEIGAARSPVNGLGQAIRNIMDTARKKGLLQAQSTFQGQASNQVNILKEQRAVKEGQRLKKTIIAGPTEGEDRIFNEQANVDIKLGREPDPFAKFFADEVVPQDEDGVSAESVTVRFSDGSTQTMSRAEAQALKSKLER